MRSIQTDVFAMSEVTVDAEVFDCVILAVHRHSRNIVASPGKNSETSHRRGKHTGGKQRPWGKELADMGRRYMMSKP